MTACLLCTSEAVADGLCVEDGARSWAAKLWIERPSEAIHWSTLSKTVPRGGLKAMGWIK